MLNRIQAWRNGAAFAVFNLKKNTLFKSCTFNYLIKFVQIKTKNYMKKGLLMLAIFAGILMGFASCGGGDAAEGGDKDSTEHAH